MYSVSPAQVELFHLRLLLSTVKGAKNFDDLKTVNGQLHSSFTHACLALGLIADDQEWNRAMHEAEVWMMPLQLRRLFVRILLHCHPIHPDELWHEFKDAMSEDFIRIMPVVEAHNRTLTQIRQIFDDEGKNVTDYLNIPQNEIIEDIVDNTYREAILQTGVENYNRLNQDQREIINTILNCVNSPTSSSHRSFYIDGAGGSGKTFLYNTLWHLLIGNGKKVIAMAYTGIAATLLPSGRTVHKTLKILKS